MSFSVTGIQAIPINVSFPGFAFGSDTASQPKYGIASTDQSGTSKLSATDAGNVAGFNKSQGAQAPLAQSSQAASLSPNAGQSVPVKQDTVTISTDAKVRDLRSQGEADTQIATTLNLPLKEVDSDLHVIANLTEILAAVTLGAPSPQGSNA